MEENTIPIRRPATNYKAIADIIEDKYIRTPHSEEEKQALQASIATHSVNLSMLNQELSEIKAEFKAKIEPETKAVKNSIVALKRGYEEHKEECYGIINHDARMMEFYTSQGELVDSRRLLPGEQLTIHSQFKD